MRKRRTESIFIGEIKKQCDSLPHCVFYKIPDAYNMDRFSPKKPFDAVLWYWRGCAKTKVIEFKAIDSCSSFAFNRVRDHQIEGLLKAQQAGAEAHIIINYRDKALEYNKAFFIDIFVFMSLKNRYEGVRKSIPFEVIKQLPQIERIKVGRKTIWDVESYLQKSVVSIFF